jgi:hypothetical protein
MLIDLLLLKPGLDIRRNPAYVVNLHLPQRAGPPVESKHFICEGYCLVALQVSNLTTAVSWPRGDVLGAELLIQPALQSRDFGRREVVYDAFVERVRDVAAVILVARPAIILVRVYVFLSSAAECKVHTQALSRYGSVVGIWSPLERGRCLVAEDDAPQDGRNAPGDGASCALTWVGLHTRNITVTTH